MDRAVLAAMIDHTLLTPTATPDEVLAACAEAVELGAGAACVSPSRLPLPAGTLPGSMGLVAVVGFPSGAHRAATKAAEASLAVEDGATEVDVVIDLGAAMAGDWKAVETDLAAVRAAVPRPIVMKVILETAVLARATTIVAACGAAEDAGADYVKTSTGFHPAGGASIEAVATMSACVEPRLGVKASGGIRTASAALAMVEAGATRLGCSATRAILDGLTGYDRPEPPF